jgi:hypothetical protein
MSSYHIINSIWISVFPLLAVTLILIVICYLICCLKRIRSKLNERNKFLKYMRNVENNENNNNRNQYEKPAQEQQQQDDTNIVKIDINEIYLPKSHSIVKKTVKTKPNSPYNHYYLNCKKFKSLNEISYLEQLEVKELNESPKSLYSKFKQQKIEAANKTTIDDNYFNQLLNRYGSKTAPTTPASNKKHRLRYKKPQKYVKSSSKSSLASSVSTSSSTFSPVNHLFNKKNSRIKLNSKHCSDIDNEDDVIFNDEDDSLSSAGLCVYNNNNNNDVIVSREKLKSGKRSFINSNQSNINIVQSSISSIEPDENILNDILIKSNNKINEIIIESD